MISPEAKATIDALSRDELRVEVEKGHRSRFQRDNYGYVKSRLAQLDEAQANQQINREHALLEEANRIARKANARVSFANRVAVVSLIVAIVSVLVAILTWRSSAP